MIFGDFTIRNCFALGFTGKCPKVTGISHLHHKISGIASKSHFSDPCLHVYTITVVIFNNTNDIP